MDLESISRLRAQCFEVRGSPQAPGCCDEERHRNWNVFFCSFFLYALPPFENTRTAIVF